MSTKKEFKQRLKKNTPIKDSEIIRRLDDGSIYIKEGVKRLGYTYDEDEYSASLINPFLIDRMNYNKYREVIQD